MISINVCHHVPNRDRLSYLKTSFPSPLYDLRLVTAGLPSNDGYAFNRIKSDAKRFGYLYSRICYDAADIFVANQMAAVLNDGLVDNDTYRNSLKALQSCGWPAVSSHSCLPAWLQPRMLTDAEISLNIKHRYCLSKFLACSKEDIIIVAEDDIVLKKSSYLLLEEILSKADSLAKHALDPLFIDIGGGCGLHATKHDRINQDLIPTVYTAKSRLTQPIWPSSRTTCAYIANKKFAELFFKILPVPCAPIDFEITYCMSKMRSVFCLWAEPPVFKHGSQDGSYKSSIQK